MAKLVNSNFTDTVEKWYCVDFKVVLPFFSNMLKNISISFGDMIFSSNFSIPIFQKE